MNATEDGTEPVGDYLDAPTFVAFTPGPGGHVTIPVLGENERQAIAEIRALHVQTRDYCDEYSCGDCGGDAPCPTIAILDKWGV